MYFNETIIHIIAISMRYLVCEAFIVKKKKKWLRCQQLMLFQRDFLKYIQNANQRVVFSEKHSIKLDFFSKKMCLCCLN